MVMQGTVEISGQSFAIYGTPEEANTYFLGSTSGAIWAAASQNDRNVALVTAARKWDVQSWVGQVTDPVTPQPLAWPRTGVTDRNGQAVPDDVIPDDVAEGNWLYAGELLVDPTLPAQQPGSNLKSTRTLERVEGAVTVENEDEFFRATIGQAPIFSQQILFLIQPFLGGAQTARGAFVSGADRKPVITPESDEFGFDGIGIDGGSNA